jgi:O-antigen/teichoic acid export membrane protein
MAAHHLVVTKLVETAARGFFMLVCIYALPLEEAGRFGLIATAVGLLAFALGFERQIDILRRVTGLPVGAVRGRFADTLRFFGVQYALLVPVLIVTGWWAGVSPEHLALGLVILAGEHFSLQAYQAVLVSPRALPLMIVVAAKNFIQLSAVLVWIALSGERLRIDWVLNLWAISSLCYLVVAAVIWRVARRAAVGSEADVLPPQSVAEQYRASWMNFLVGTVAVAALQIDRLVVGGVLGAADVGVYFRNITLASLALQVFNVASFNRVAPGVYMRSRDGALDVSAGVVRREYRRFAGVLVAAAALVLGTNLALGEPLHHWRLETPFLALMAVAVLLRAAADYDGLILLSVGSEGAVFRNQAAAVLIGATALFLMARFFGLIGAFVGALTTPLLYLFFNRASVRQRLAAGAVPT